MRTPPLAARGPVTAVAVALRVGAVSWRVVRGTGPSIPSSGGARRRRGPPGVSGRAWAAGPAHRDRDRIHPAPPERSPGPRALLANNPTVMCVRFWPNICRQAIMMWYAHPRELRYAVSPDGLVVHLATGQRVGRPDNEGYMQFGHRPARRIHRFVWECFHSMELDRSLHQIHHIDGDKQNNAIGNLQLVSPAEHNRITTAENPDCRRIWHQKMERPVRRITETDEVTFPSAKAAVEATTLRGPFWGVNRSSDVECLENGIRGACSGRCKTHAGYKWLYADVPEPDLPGEVWAGLTDPLLKGILVSSNGRIKALNGRHTSYGSLKLNGYREIKVRKKHQLVHRLVCLAFHGRCPEGCTVDHIDRNTQNNIADNLRWATMAQQVGNKRKRV